MNELMDRTAQWIAWRVLPRRVVMWCAIRVVAHATQGQWSAQIVPELTAMDAIARWRA